MKSRVIAGMFWLGCLSTLAQVTLTREMLVAFLGNELTIGTILAAWLVSIGAGAFSSRLLSGAVKDPKRIRRFLTGVLLAMSAVFPAQVLAVRSARMVLGVPLLEYVSGGGVVLTAVTVLFPLGWCIGVFFPFACRLLALTDGSGAVNDAGTGVWQGSAVSAIYAAEALGSASAGVVLTFVLLPVMSPAQIILSGVAVGFAGAAFTTGGKKLTAAYAAAGTILLAGAVMNAGAVKRLEEHLVGWRWKAFGVIEDAGDVSRQDSGAEQRDGEVTLVAWEDTVYRNLAVTRLAGQYTLYGNGRVMFSFPDPYEYESSVHFMMAQNPSAGRILVLGGNAVDVIPALLKYPVEEIVYVNLDPGVGRLLRAIVPARWEAAFSDPRVRYVTADAPRFARTCRERFDIVAVYSPEPATAAANRFYTLEFYESIKRILSPRGFLYTSVHSSERLRSEAVNIAASVYRTLREVFDVVLVTAESRNRFFAGGRESGLSFDREVLYEHSRDSGVKSEVFDPRIILGTDVIAEEKVRFVQNRLEEARAALNTNIRPVTYFYNLMVWGRISDSGVTGFLKAIEKLRVHTAGLWLIVFGAVCAAAGFVMRRVRKAGAPSWSRLMFALVIGTTGFCAMGIEIVLIFVFQNLYGYVYAKIGLIVAMFMLGLVIGAPSGRFFAGRGPRGAVLAAVGLDSILLALLFAVPFAVRTASTWDSGGTARLLMEGLIYGLVLVSGWAVGAEFPVANRLYFESGAEISAGAAVTDATDHTGSAVGSIAVGVVLVPVLGIAGSCATMAALKCASLLCLSSGLATMPTRRV
ncbi:MAG: hypothetical protein R6V03_09165 [Kiritimatiellia bacterium]